MAHATGRLKGVNGKAQLANKKFRQVNPLRSVVGMQEMPFCPKRSVHSFINFNSFFFSVPSFHLYILHSHTLKTTMDIEDLGHLAAKPKVTNVSPNPLVFFSKGGFSVILTCIFFAHFLWQYNPCTVRNLRPGSIKEWCTCGLTKKGPWYGTHRPSSLDPTRASYLCSNRILDYFFFRCDGKSHKGTSFKPLRWKVPDGKNAQTMYSICDCRYTTRPPYVFHDSPCP